jgi:hypothetical protein
VFSITLMRAARSDVLRETHQSSSSTDKIGQGRVYYRDTECITKLYLGSRMTDADKKKSKEPLRCGHVKSGSPTGFVPTKRPRKNMSAACSFSRRRAEDPQEHKSPPASGGLHIFVDYGCVDAIIR